MKFENIKFTQSGSISATVDGIEMSIPADPGNRHYAELLAQGITSEPYTEPLPTAEQIRSQRDQLLAASDWIITKSYETNQPVPTNWAEYRQALRDITAQPDFPETVTWPQPPN